VQPRGHTKWNVLLFNAHHSYSSWFQDPYVHLHGCGVAKMLKAYLNHTLLRKNSAPKPSCAYMKSSPKFFKRHISGRLTPRVDCVCTRAVRSWYVCTRGGHSHTPISGRLTPRVDCVYTRAVRSWHVCTRGGYSHMRNS